MNEAGFQREDFDLGAFLCMMENAVKITCVVHDKLRCDYSYCGYRCFIHCDFYD